MFLDPWLPEKQVQFSCYRFPAHFACHCFLLCSSDVPLHRRRGDITVLRLFPEKVTLRSAVMQRCATSAIVCRAVFSGAVSQPPLIARLYGVSSLECARSACVPFFLS